MKEISREEIEKNVHKEYEAARDFVAQDNFRYYEMMIDVSDGSIWSDVFLSTTDWNVYDSESIMKLEEDFFATVKEQEDLYVRMAIRLLEKHGWIIK